MLNEYDRAILIVDLPEYDLKAGDVGTVVYVHQAGKGYEVEFFTLDGETLDVVTLNADQLRAFDEQDD